MSKFEDKAATKGVVPRVANGDFGAPASSFIPITGELIMTGLDATQLEDVCGGGVAGKVLKLGGPVLDAGTSLYDGYQSYSQARADNKSVAQSLGEGAVGTVRASRSTTCGRRSSCRRRRTGYDRRSR